MLTQERIIADLERKHLTKGPGETYIALEDEEFGWTMKEVEEFDQLWKDGLSLEYIADYFGRTILQTGILVACRSKKEMISPRKHGLFGGLEIN